MTRNIEKRRFKRTPLRFELENLTFMIKEKQEDRIIQDGLEEVKDEEYENPQGFLEEIW